MAERTELTWDVVRVEDISRIAGMDLLYAEFANEEYIHFEIDEDEDGQSVMWSTADDVTVFLDKVRGVMGAPSASSDFWSYAHFSDGTKLESTPAQVEAEVLKRPDEVSVLIGGYADAIVAWTKPKIKMIAGMVPHSEASISSQHVGRERLVALLTQTATSRVVEAVYADESPLSDRIAM